MPLMWDVSTARMVDDLVLDLGKAMDKAMAVVGERYGTEIAKGFVKDLRAHIEHQIFHHAPLTANYAEWKRKQSLDPRILIATGDYLDAVEVVSLPGGAGVGMKPGHHQMEDGGIGPEFDELADWLENGTKGKRLSALRVSNERGGLPPRPHWLPMIERWTAKAAQLTGVMGDLYTQEVIQELRKKGHIANELPYLEGGDEE